MYYDQVRNAYIDAESGAVVLQEDEGIELADIYYSEQGRTTETSPERSSIPTATIARPSNSYTPLSKKSRGIAPSPEERVADLEQDLYDLHMTGQDTVDPTVAGSTDRGVWDDWSFARTLQALEFEIPLQALEGRLQYVLAIFLSSVPNLYGLKCFTNKYRRRRRFQ